MRRYSALEPLTAPVLRRLSDAISFISSSLDVKLFRQTFNDLAFCQKEQDYRRHFNDTARLLRDDVKIADRFVLLRFLYGAVVHRYESAFCEFLAPWWRQTNRQIGAMDVKHVSALFYCLGRINYDQKQAVRKHLQRDDILRCENQLVASNRDVLTTESWHLRRATSGMADLMMVLDETYPSDELAILLMDYILKTIYLQDSIIGSIDHLRYGSCHLSNCSSILLNLTEMGVCPEEACLIKFIEALKFYNFNFGPTKEWSTKSIDVFIDLVLASDRFGQCCKLANLNPDDISNHCLTTWYLDNEQQLQLATTYLNRQLQGEDINLHTTTVTPRFSALSENYLPVSDDIEESSKNEFRFRHVLKQLLLTILDVTIRFERTREMTSLFPLWRVVMATLIDLSRRKKEPFMPRSFIKQTLDNLRIYETRTKRMNLFLSIGRPWEDVVAKLKLEIRNAL